MDAKKTGNIICKYRKKKNLTQEELAKKLFITSKAVSKWERGLSLPDISVLIPLSEALDLSIYDLLKGEESNGKE